MKVLIVDDSVKMRDCLAAWLRPLGVIVVQAANGLEAVDAFIRTSPDWTLMDIEMPGMDGLSAAGEIRRLSPEARIAIVSAHDTPGFRRAALEVGVRGFLSKSELHRIAEVLGIPELNSRNEPES
ncbi:MAG: response regulator transcription factor [Limisphaerales bacterium]